MSIAALLLGDSRFPAGGHAHSGGVEPAVTAGTVTDLVSLEAFLRGRLRTAGLVAAGLSAAACARSAGERRAGEPNAALAADSVGLAAEEPVRKRATAGERGDGVRDPGRGNWNQPLVHTDGFDFWGAIDAEADARTPSPAQRAASRRQGRALLRSARIAWPEDRGLAGLAAAGAAVVAEAGQGSAGGPHRGVVGDAAAARATGSGASAEYRGGPHQAVVLGAAAAAAGCDTADAARIAAYQSVAGPASAAVRLLALDPMRATAVLARLSGDIDLIAERAAAAADGPLAELPCPSAPALDLLAEAHVRAEVRLFES
ncbi:MAG: urease accessory UreF family protein [Trebonia sp.]